MFPPPFVAMFETKFINLDNLSIGNFQGVTRISVSFVAFSFMTTNFVSFSRI